VHEIKGLARPPRRRNWLRCFNPHHAANFPPPSLDQTDRVLAEADLAVFWGDAARSKLPRLSSTLPIRCVLAILSLLRDPASQEVFQDCAPPPSRKFWLNANSKSGMLQGCLQAQGRLSHTATTRRAE